MQPRWWVPFLVVIVAACGDGDADPIDAGSDSLGEPCGGKGGGSCGPSEYCEMRYDTCGVTDEGGHCVARPTACPDPVPQPVCGCDGVVYSLACDAHQAGVDLNDSGSGCTAPSGTFACGARFCRLADEYCEHQLSSTEVPDGWACRALPAGCGGSPSCACLPCGNACTGTAASGLQVNCPSV